MADNDVHWNRRKFLTSTAAVSGAALAGCTGSGGGGGELSEFNLARVPFVSTGSYYLPLQWEWVDTAGMIEHEHINWNVQQPNQITELVRGEEVEIAQGSLGAHLINNERGVTGYPALATDNELEKANALYTHDESDIEEPQDLAGAKIGVHSQSSASVVYSLGILENYYDVDLDTVEWVNQSPPQLFSLLEQNDLDAAVLFADFWWIADGMPVMQELFNTAEAWADWTGGRESLVFQVVLVQEEWVNNNSGVDEDLLRTLQRSRDYREENLREIIERYAEEKPDVDVDQTIKEAKALEISFDLTDQQRDQIDQFIQLANEQGVIDSTPSVDELFLDTADRI